MQAYRIMEALSAVDEELLARCQRDHGRARKACGLAHGTYKAQGAAWRYARICAAAVCFAVIGTASLGGYQLMMGGRKGDAGAASGGSDMNGQVQQSMQEMEQAKEMEEVEGADGACPEEPFQMPENSMDADWSNQDGYESAARVESDLKKEAQKESVLTDGMPEAVESRLLTWEEARNLEDFGGYVPSALPEGYAFEEASYCPGNPGSLRLLWSRGTDGVTWNIRKGQDSLSTVDDPVFPSGDFSLEIVKSRMVAREDAGDADAPRGHFSVSYPDGTLVSFDGCGTAEEIWEMFRSMEEGLQ